MGRFKFSIHTSYQVGLMLRYERQKVTVQLPFLTASYCWGSDASGTHFYNGIGK
jgi:hypothetical protein